MLFFWVGVYKNKEKYSIWTCTKIKKNIRYELEHAHCTYCTVENFSLYARWFLKSIKNPTSSSMFTLLHGEPTI
jgi:hypothetical protein